MPKEIKATEHASRKNKGAAPKRKGRKKRGED
jgi:hypothetical protein